MTDEVDDGGPSDDEELPVLAYLRDLAERLRNVPAMYGVDGYDIDRLTNSASDLESAVAAYRMVPNAEACIEKIGELLGVPTTPYVRRPPVN